MKSVGGIKDIIGRCLGSDNRTKEVRANTMYMFVIRLISISISLLYVPLLLNTLEAPQYGVWLTLTSIVVWIGLMDIGLGNGLRNKLVESLAVNDIVRSRKLISSGYAALFIIAFVFAIIFCIVSGFVNWQHVFNTSDVPATELDSLVLIVILAFLAQFILNLLSSILFAFQKPALTALITMTNNVLSYLLVLLCVRCFQINSLLVLGSIISCVPIITLSIGTFIFFFGYHKELAPSIQCVELSSLKDIMSLGLQFFVIQIVTIVLYQFNNILISHTVSPSAVVQYNIPHKFFNVVDMLFVIVVTPIWSAASDAYVRGDMPWIIKTRQSVAKVRYAVSIGGILMLIMSPFVYDLWLGKGHIAIPLLTSALILSDFLFKMAYSNYGFFINGIGKIRAQLVITSVVAVLYIPLAILLSRFMGLNGVLLASVMVNVTNYLWSSYQFKKITTNTAHGIWDL